MAPLASRLQGKIEVLHLADAQSALDALSPMLRGGDVILVKGSNAVGLGHLVADLTMGDA
jgi:UDP-N-acetylmuramoyl-tripeptide--D-alanyl-D-alanine ligase